MAIGHDLLQQATGVLEIVECALRNGDQLVVLWRDQNRQALFACERLCCAFFFGHGVRGHCLEWQLVQRDFLAFDEGVQSLGGDFDLAARDLKFEDQWGCAEDGASFTLGVGGASDGCVAIQLSCHGLLAIGVEQVGRELRSSNGAIAVLAVKANAEVRLDSDG